MPDTSPPAGRIRDPLFDVAKGIGILLVLGHHSFNNSARNYTVLHSTGWWALALANRVLDFSVPVFILISAVLSARGLVKRPEVGPFYRRRLTGILWPYLVWSGIYWLARMATDHSALRPYTVKILGAHLTGPALLFHFKLRLLDLVWGKASFHLYFLVVLLELMILLPLAIRYVAARKPGFLEMAGTAVALQAAIFVAQHLTGLLPYPASTALWYIGSLLPGAWIGVNWDLFLGRRDRYVWPLVAISVASGAVFLWQEIRTIRGVPADNYTSNGALAIYSSCLSILVLYLAFALAKKTNWRRVLEPLGLNSLQLYLIHPAVMQLLDRPRIVRVINPTYLGPLLSPALMLAITIGLIFAFRKARVERLLFGRG